MCAVALMLIVAPGMDISAGESPDNSMQKLEELAQQAQQADESKDYPKAITLLEQILKKHPDPMLEYNLACAYAKSGNKTKALDHLAKAISMGLNDTEHMEKDPDLDSLRKSPGYSGIIKKANDMAVAQGRAVAAAPDPEDLFLEAEGVTKEQKTPLLIFLHGMGGSPRNVKSFMAPLAKAWQYSIFLPCGSVKMGMRPDGQPAYNWDAKKDPQTIIRKIKTMKGILQDQVYLAGFSSGACMSYLIALDDPAVFAGVIAFSGGLQKEYLSEEQLRKASGKIPFYIVHGNQDAMMPLSLGKDTRDYLKKQGFSVLLKEFQGGHSLPANYFDIIKEAIAWFHQQPEPSGVKPDWEVKETAHFLLHFDQASPAERDIQQLASLFERYFEETSSMFIFRPTVKINCFFHNTFPLKHGKATVWGFVDKDGVHMVYTEKEKDSSSHELGHFFHDAVNPNAPYFFNEGACGIGINIGGKNFFQLAKETKAAEQSLSANIERFGFFGRDGNYVAYSFCEFLAQRYGTRQFGAFYCDVTTANYRSKLEELSKLSFSELEEAWKTTVRNTQMP